MNSKRLPILLTVLVMAAILASLLTPARVMAAGEPPPPPGEKAGKQPTAAKPAPPQPASPTGVSYISEAPMTAPDGAAAAQAVALNVEAIAQANVVLVGPQGNPLPMAARETVILLTTPDAYFKCTSGPECVSGYAHFSTIAMAVAAFPANHGSGSIYANSALDELAVLDVNGAALSLSKLTGLSWDEVGNYTPVLSELLTIQHMLKGFTVEGFSVLKGLYAHDNAGTLRLQNLYVTNHAWHGIRVESHTGNIDLFNVTVEQTEGDGAHLDNSAGTGNVTISNSSFNGNLERGLSVNTWGSVLLERVEANGNEGDGNRGGAVLNVGKGATVKDSRFNSNQGLGFSDGLDITGTGALKLQNVEALVNVKYGIHLNTASDITLDGALVAGNTFGSLDAYSSGGNITLNHLQVLNNGHGALVSNAGAATTKKVTITNSLFSGIPSYGTMGLEVYSRGSIALDNVQAMDNLGNLHVDQLGRDVAGIYLDNCLYNGTACTGTGAVSVKSVQGPSKAQGNIQSYGLLIESHGAITVSGFSGSANGAGAYLDNKEGSAAVSITNSTFSNNSGTQGGLTVLSAKAITLNGVEASQNSGGVGAVLGNIYGTTATDVITISKSNFNDNQSGGLAVLAKGNLTLNNVSASQNAGMAFSFGAQLVSLTGSFTLLDTLGPNQFSHNVYNGLVVSAKGTISLSGVTASYNSAGMGIGLTNTSAMAAKTVTAQKILAEHNGKNGLNVNSKGSVTLNRVQANDNTEGYGVSIDTCNLSADCTTSGDVSILSTLGPNSMFGNKFGMLIVAAGNVLVNGMTVSWNAGTLAYTGGVTIYNDYIPGKTVKVNQSNFSFNGHGGLFVRSKGAITLNNIGASNNADNNGLYLSNEFTPAKGAAPGVSLLSTLGNNQVISNAGNGLWITTYGNISLSKVIASDNGAGGSFSGAVLHTIGASSITLTCSAFNHNGKYGLDVTLVSGKLAFKSVSANSNTDLQQIRQIGGTRTTAWQVCGH